jgi:DME family drug/metabolite transporter
LSTDTLINAVPLRREAPWVTGASAISGHIAIVLAATSWASLGIAMKLSLGQVSALSIAAARIGIGGVALMVFTAKPRRVAALVASKHRCLMVTTAALAMAAHQVLLFASFQLAGVAIGSVVSLGTSPLFIGLVAWLVHREQPSIRWWMSTAVAVVGCALLVAGKESGTGTDQSLGTLCALGAGFAFAVFTLAASKLVNDGACSRAVIASSFFVAGLMLLPVLAVSGSGWILQGNAPVGMAYIVIVATVGAYLMYGHGIRKLPAHVVGTLSLAEPAGGALLAVLVLNEHLPSTGYLGIFAILAALLLVKK